MFLISMIDDGEGAKRDRFALKELRLILATLVRRYVLSLVEGQSHELRVHSVPWFKQGFYKVGVKLRD